MADFRVIEMRVDWSVFVVKGSVDEVSLDDCYLVGSLMLISPC